MANTADVHVINLPLGAYNGATHVPLARFPNYGGAVTILEAALVGPAAGTAIGGLLVTLADEGTPSINGTIGSLDGTVVTAAGVRHNFTLSDATMDDGRWIGFDQTSGTVPAGTFISLSYVTGV